MNLNVSVYETGSPAPPASTPGTFNVRAFYTETDAGHLYGPFSTREKAEECAVTLSARTDVVKAVVEG